MRASGRSTLVDRDDRLQAKLERLADHEFGLRHRTFGGVDKHDDAVDHRQDALDLTAEIGVARGVDDVDLGVFPMHRGALGENGDAALALQIVGVHGTLDLTLVVAVGAGLLQQLVDEGGLAVVDVGDDGDVAKVHSSSSGSDNAGARSHRKTGTHFSGSHSETWSSRGREAPKKEARPKDRAHPTRCGAI